MEIQGCRLMFTFPKTAFGRLSKGNREVDSNLNQSNVALSAGDFDLAANHAELSLGNRRASRNQKLAANFLLIRVRSRQGNFSDVLDELDALFEKVSRSNSALQAKIANEIMWVCFRSGNLGIGAQRGEAFYAKYKNIWPAVELVELLCQLSSCHFHRGDTTRAEELVEKALKLADKVQSAKGWTQAYWQSSSLNIDSGDLPLALQQNNQARSWAQIAELKNVMPILNTSAALILLNLPNSDLARIHQLAEEAYLELTLQNAPGGASYACEILSEVALRRDDYEKALAYAQKGLAELPPQIPGPKASLFVQVAKVHARMGDYVVAKTELRTASEHMEQLEPSKELAKQWGDLARVYVEVGLTDRGVYAYEKAIQMSGLLREEQESRVP